MEPPLFKDEYYKHLYEKICLGALKMFETRHFYIVAPKKKESEDDAKMRKNKKRNIR